MSSIQCEAGNNIEYLINANGYNVLSTKQFLGNHSYNLMNHRKQNSIATTSKEKENKLEGKKNLQIPNR